MREWLFTPVNWKFMEHVEGINIKIIRQLNESGIEFAFPTQTMHVLGKNINPINSEDGTKDQKDDKE